MKEKIDLDMNVVLDMIEDGATRQDIADFFKVSRNTVKRRIKELQNEDVDILKENTRLAKQKQRLQDINRIERKAFRNQARAENAMTEISEKLIDVFEKHKIPESIRFCTKSIKKTNKSAVIHITDAHFNELVDLIFNKYDFTEASKRFQLYAEKIKIYSKNLEIDNILIAMTGDMMNSDRRMDEILAQATNRSKATFLAVCILRNFIVDIAKEFKVTVASVIGNESRVDKDIGWVEAFASHNYDYTIYNILKLIFKEKNITFLGGDSVEQIVEVCGQNILLVHGNQIPQNNVEKSIQKIKGKYSARGVKIDFVIFGHLHSCRIGDTYARSSSFVGGNAYSDSALQLESRASQNIHVFYKNGMRDSIKIDLQNVDGIKGYPIIKELEEYNAKSVDKAKKKVIIQRLA